MLDYARALLVRLDFGAIALVAIAISFGLVAWGVTAAQATLNGRAVEAMARQPEVAEKIRGHVFLMTTFQESIGLFALFLLFLSGRSILSKYVSTPEPHELKEMIQKEMVQKNSDQQD